MRPYIPHPKNAPGDFYVEDGCCTLCGIPESKAPNLFSSQAEESVHCYVSRQPQFASELNQMLDVMWSQEFTCIRYRGLDREIHRRLISTGNAVLCDNLPFWARVREWLHRRTTA